MKMLNHTIVNVVQIKMRIIRVIDDYWPTQTIAILGGY
jgi:hypothetical protein